MWMSLVTLKANFASMNKFGFIITSLHLTVMAGPLLGYVTSLWQVSLLLFNNIVVWYENFQEFVGNQKSNFQQHI